MDAARARDRRSSLSESLGSAPNVIVTSSFAPMVRASKPSFFVVIATFSEMWWAKLAVVVLDYLVPGVSHFSRRQGTKNDQRNVFEVTGGT